MAYVINDDCISCGACAAGYPATHDSKHSPPDSKLLRCRIHHNNSYPENNAFHKNSYPCPDKPVNWRFYYSCRTAKPFFITACNT